MVTANDLQDPDLSMQLVDHTNAFTNVDYTNNRYFTNKTASQWFDIGNVSKSYAQWLTESGETGSTDTEVTYTDPDRDEITYMTSIGETATFEAFITACRAQRKGAWDTNFTAAVINDYFRAGFGL